MISKLATLTMLIYILGNIFIKRWLTHNLSPFSLSQESKNCWEFKFPPGNTPDSYSDGIWNFLGLMIMNKLIFITVDSTAQMHYFMMSSRLWAFITQALLAKNTKFLCPLDWKFPEFFKTHPTFICSSFLRASRSIWTLTGVFFGTPCICHNIWGTS